MNSEFFVATAILVGVGLFVAFLGRIAVPHVLFFLQDKWQALRGTQRRRFVAAGRKLDLVNRIGRPGRSSPRRPSR